MSDTPSKQEGANYADDWVDYSKSRIARILEKVRMIILTAHCQFRMPPLFRKWSPVILDRPIDVVGAILSRRDVLYDGSRRYSVPKTVVVHLIHTLNKRLGLDLSVKFERRARNAAKDCKNVQDMNSERAA
jgi:hypothetical protein